MPAHPKHNGLCLNHATVHRRTTVREDDLSAELTAAAGEFTSHAEIHRVLGKMFGALAGNRMSPKRAATLAYIAYLMLIAKKGMEFEVRMIELQGAKDLSQMLDMKYGKARRKARPSELAAEKTE